MRGIGEGEYGWYRGGGVRMDPFFWPNLDIFSNFKICVAAVQMP